MACFVPQTEHETTAHTVPFAAEVRRTNAQAYAQDRVLRNASRDGSFAGLSVTFLAGAVAVRVASERGCNAIVRPECSPGIQTFHFKSFCNASKLCRIKQHIQSTAW